ncbi:hypothetical protein BTK98_001601 [Enterobacter roggenkampii]|nr:hypothetical protein [Enterobacter roggenkampii]
MNTEELASINSFFDKCALSGIKTVTIVYHPDNHELIEELAEIIRRAFSVKTIPDNCMDKGKWLIKGG